MSEEDKKKGTKIDYKVINKIRNDNHLDFLEDLASKGLPLTPEQILALKKDGRNVEAILNVSTDESLTSTKFDKTDLGFEIEIPEFGNGHYKDNGVDIKTSEWMPESVLEHTQEFYDFVTSMNEQGFQKKVTYEPLKLYIQQAHNWLADKKTMEDCVDREEKIAYFNQEWKRCLENSLYFVDKYLYLKETDEEDGSSIKYLAKPVHEVLLFLADCGYSMIIGKPRQIAATTTFQGWAIKKMTFVKNIFIKFVTMDVDTAEEIMEDKLKFPVSQLPKWLRPSVKGDSHEGLTFGRTIPGQKGARGGANSRFGVVAPSVSAINAGAPPIVMVDEAGYIKVLGKMIRESRPTMFRQDLKTGKLAMKRQLIIWSTGGVDEGKNRVKTKSFEEEVNHARDKWKKKEFDYGIVPIFFDWTTRPGISKKFYESEKRNYTSDGPDKEQKMNQFRLTYPSRWEDMFLTESKTLIPSSAISWHEDRIIRAGGEFDPQPGYFEPVLDMNSPTTANDDFGYKVIGAEFVPVEHGSDRATTWIFMHPERGWKHRYYKGTDPIMSDNGYSNMASSIWDKKLNTISAIMNYRDDDYKYSYQQCFLMGLYYNPDKHHDGVPELLESNIGTSYRDYVDNKGYFHTLVYRTQLPDIFQGGGQLIGIDNRAMRNKFIINKMDEMFQMYGKNFYFLVLFAQLRTFVCVMNERGNEIWGVSDKRQYQDDTLFSSVFSYICSTVDENPPRYFSSETEKHVERWEGVTDKYGNYKRVLVKKRIY